MKNGRPAAEIPNESRNCRRADLPTASNPCSFDPRAAAIRLAQSVCSEVIGPMSASSAPGGQPMRMFQLYVG